MAIDLVDIAAGTGGFVLHGEDAGDESGFSVSSAGDVNGDGYDDIIIGAPFGDGPGAAPGTRDTSGDSYVVFGHAGGFAAAIDLANVAAGVGGFVIHGQDSFDQSGISVSAAGDVNGDGFADVVIGAWNGAGPGNTRFDAGDSYVVFGHSGAFANVDLAIVAGNTGGFKIFGEKVNEESGYSVSAAGDVNGDGFADVIVGAPAIDGGYSYVVYGHGGTVHSADLVDIDQGIGGFVIRGEHDQDQSGWSVAGAGDVNGDGYDDLIVGAWGADGNAVVERGYVYVVYGPGPQDAGFGHRPIDLTDVAAGRGGFVIRGEDGGDRAGWSVSSAGDVNGDGFADLIIGAVDGDGPGNARADAGDSYVVFGHAGSSTAINLSDVAAGTGGFVIHGGEAGDASGGSVSSAGDINGDGFDDLLIGAPGGDGASNARPGSGDSYVVFGHSGAFGAVDLDAVANGVGGFRILGEEASDGSGNSVAAAGDINGDGFADLIVGAPAGDGPGNARTDAGDSYVIFGSATIGGSADHVTHHTTNNNLSPFVAGTTGADVMVGGVIGDVFRGNGGADVLIGAKGDDFLEISDATFQRVEGGDGFDTLVLFGSMTLADTDFRRVSGMEDIRIDHNSAINLTLGPIASHAIDGLAANAFQIDVDGLAVTNAAVTIDGSTLARGLTAFLGNDAHAVTLAGGAGNDHLTSGSGDDVLYGSAGTDQLTAGGGFDQVIMPFGHASITSDSFNPATSSGVLHGSAYTATLSGVDAVAFTEVQHGGGFKAGEAQYADLNGDGQADLIYQGTNNAFWVSLSTGSGFARPSIWVQHGGGFQAGEAQYADVNGDGKADLIYQGTNNAFWVSISKGSGFADPSIWVQHGGGFQAGEAQYADVNGDGKADLIYQGTSNAFWVSLSTGTGFTDPAIWVQHGGSFHAGEAQYADVNGDGMADLIYQGTNNAFWVSLSTGTGFTNPSIWVQHGGAFAAGEAQYADVNGDGKADLIYQGTNNAFWVSLSTGTGFTNPSIWVQHGGTFAAGEAQYADLNGDGKSDLIYFGKADQVWESRSTGSGFTAPAEVTHFDGNFLAGELKVTDVNGDHHADLAMQTLTNQFQLSLNGADFHLV